MLVTWDPTLTESTWNCTPAMPTLEEAEADTAVEPDTVDPATGDEIETEGGVVGTPVLVMKLESTLVTNVPEES